MPTIYSVEWFDEVRDAINERTAQISELPDGIWTVRIEIVGDGSSPYLDSGSERHFLLRLEDGQCSWYREVAPDDDDSEELDYRFRGSATAFDEIAAGVTDPIDAALQGSVRVRGDMRFLMRQAELVQVLLEAYAAGVETAWPKGRPPYRSAEAEVVGA